MTEGKALELATAAMAESARATERIANHEKLCAFRWAILIKLLGSTFATVIGVAGLLLYDKFF